ncbi:unnamed protein product [Rodentolepis nana]|uniref:Protein FAM114A2 n=1 Tax=Rodentolepis nana TaxID=102285 RepID=A0A0R3U0L6_RODNA|nr:unnamed protein product [Rodentolepis nana]
MSGDSSDEFFASADEGSDTEMSPIAKPINSKPVEDSSIVNPEPSDVCDLSEDKSSPSTSSPDNLLTTDQKKTSIGKPLSVSKDGDNLVSIAKFEDTSKSQLTPNKSVNIVEEDAWDIEDDPWLDLRESKDEAASISHLKSRKEITDTTSVQKKDLPSEDVLNPEDKIELDVASQQTESAPTVLATQPISIKVDRQDIVNDVSKFTSESFDQTPIKTTVSENPINSENTDAWHVEDNLCIEIVDEPFREVEKDPDLLQNIPLQKVGDSSTEEVGASDKEFKSQQKLVKEDFSNWVPAEEENVWDLIDDPWVESQSKEGEKLDSWDLKSDPWSKTEALKQESSTEGNLDNMGDLRAKLSALGGGGGSPSSTPQELASAASALVKSVGGGLASFVGGIKLPNLSSFEEPRASELPPDCETNDRTAGDSGWSAWNLGSIAKSLTSAVENTVSFLLFFPFLSFSPLTVFISCNDKLLRLMWFIFGWGGGGGGLLLVPEFPLSTNWSCHSNYWV